MSEDIIIDVQHVWKRYGLPPLLPWKRKAECEQDYALKDITFQVRRGGSLGILGRNGAGKSTLLKLLAGVTPADKGRIDIKGSIFPMIELSAGISMELTGRENIKLLASIMGFSTNSIGKLEEEVVDFTELGIWLDKPVWQYSSGMQTRLGFAIAVHARTDILLVDEVLAVGDMAFQKKCLQTMYSLLNKGVTLLYVSHNPTSVVRLCEESILLSKGNLLYKGNSIQALDKYYEITNISGKMRKNMLNEENRPGIGDIRITNIMMYDEHGMELDYLPYGSDIFIKIYYHAKCEVCNTTFGFDIKNSRDEIIFHSHTNNKRLDIINKGSGIVNCIIKNQTIIEKGLSITFKVKGDIVQDIVENAIIIDAKYSNELLDNGVKGIVHYNTEWSLENIS